MSTGCLVIIKSVKYPFLDCFMTADVAFYSVNRHLRFIQPDGVENIGGYWNMVCRLNDSGCWLSYTDIINISSGCGHSGSL
ncbi:hypothetical protein OIU78_019111 [Salix suchowensis]|nr:hypothetical protein OIU78_019111 [Salix suchowensis]